ncbi:hypothetical protein [Lacticaseibacillus absianus]|uniref:hypothetical protein n=1 Tax=Lacticaseibacillus absianus TaxID=2729623 RepID=UPI0015C6AFE4|nr:hypothetical protein [Lacticaseibacillus absianus]
MQQRTRQEMIDYLRTNRPDVPASNWAFYEDQELAQQVELMKRWVVQHTSDELAMA